MPRTIDSMIDDLVEREGGYVDHPADRGGPTRFGITQAKAKADGWTGDMKTFPITRARAIYWRDFVKTPGIDQLAARCPRLAAEALDTGVNMGATWGVIFLQTALDAFNNQGKLWPDLRRVDGIYGGETDRALAACLSVRAKSARNPVDPVDVLLSAMNAQQGQRYLTIIDRNRSQEAFAWGWFANRVLAAA